MSTDVREQIRQLAAAFDVFVDDVSVDEAIERVDPQAVTGGQGRRRRWQEAGRVVWSQFGVAAAAVILVVGLVVALVWIDRNGSDPVSAPTSPTAPSTSAPAPAPSWGQFVWPAPPRSYATPNELIAVFTSEVLGWAEFGLDGELSDQAEPQAFTIVNSDLDTSLAAIAIPSPDGWGFVQIGSSISATTDGRNVLLAFPGADAVTSSSITVRLSNGDTAETTSTSTRAVIPDVELGQLVSALVIGRDDDGNAVAVAGGQFSPDVPTVSTVVEQPPDPGTTPPETSEPPSAASVTVPVSYSDAPPLYTPVPFATVERPSSVDGDVQFAVGDGIIVLIGGDANVNVLDTATGTTTQRQLAVGVSQPVFGPDNLLYGLSFTPPTGESPVPEAAIVAQPIDGDPIEVVDSVDVSPLAYLERPLGTLVAGPDGIYDVDRSRGKVMDYVGSGTVDLPTPALIDSESTEGTVVRSGDGSAVWMLAVEQHPNAANPFVGERPAAPGPNGATRVVRYIGPRLETEPVDFGTPTHPVIADLRLGTGRWWSLPDDWSVAESSARGTLLVRDVGQRFELAWFEPESLD